MHVYVSDGRSFMRSSKQHYDALQMTLVDTWASTSAGAFSLSENNLYTVEAFQEYFQRLNADGVVSVTRWEFAKPREALRVVSQEMEALRRLGVSDTTANFIVLSDGTLTADGESATVLAKKTPFTAEEQRSLVRWAEQMNPRNAPARQITVQYMPDMSIAGRPGHPVYTELIRGQDPQHFSDLYTYNVAPVTDNAPFFFFTMKPGQVLREKSMAGDLKVNLGVVVLVLLFVISVAAVLLFLVLPLALSREARSGRNIRLLYFIAVGLGFIAVEISFIQRFVLFLGNPTYAITVVVFLLLLSSAAGSILSRRWLHDPTRVAFVIALIVAAIMVYVFALPHLLAAMVGLPFAVKLLISAAMLIPLGFAMGMPFPSGLRALSAAAIGYGPATKGIVEWAWAMNAASSVLGSVLAMIIAIQFGFNVALACGAAAYAAALLLIPTLKGHAAAS